MQDYLGIIGAMEIEVALLKERMKDVSVTTVAGLELYTGSLGGQAVVVARCGIGKVNAALCTQILIDRCAPSAIINTGVAGSLDPTLDIGDIVVSTDCVQHDFDVAALGYAPGIIPDQEVSFFPADMDLCTAALDAAATVAPEITVRTGRIASGDQFVGNGAEHERIASFGALCCEMEGAAIAQVAWTNGVPFAVIRAISDKANGSSQIDYPSFRHEASVRSAAIVEQLVHMRQDRKR